MNKRPTFLRDQATKSQGPQGTRSASGVAMMKQVIDQVMAVFNKLILPAKPENVSRASASPLAGGPMSPRRGPAPPPGAVRRTRPEDESDNADEGDNR